MKKNDRKMIINFFSILLLPAVSLGLLGPLEMYAGNYTNFIISLWTVLIAEGTLSILCLIAGTIILYVLPQKISKVLCYVIFVISVMAYIQYLFLNMKLANEDGTPMDWTGEMHSVIVKNTAIWIVGLIVIISILIILKKRAFRTAAIVSVCLALVQLVAVVSILITTPKGSNGEYRFSSEDQYTLAKDENLIVLILDSYGNRIMDATLEEHPDLLDGLKDFTYYNNADCHYDRTYPSTVAMLTGEPFDFNLSNPDEYTTRGWNNESTQRFFKLIHDDGWSFNIFAVNTGRYYGKLENTVGKVDNVFYSPGKILWKRVLIRFTNISFYKFSPYLMKPLFEELTDSFNDTNGHQYTFDDHLEHLSRILNEEGFKVDDNVDKRIMYLHTFGAHDAENTDDVVYIQSYINLFMDELKKVGKYDNSTIIVTADHGSLWSFVDDDPQPIYFIKLPGETHDKVRVSTAPISHDDFRATVLKCIGIDSDEFGTSVFEWSDGDKRERTVYFHDEGDRYYGYTYYTNREELLEKLKDGPTTVGEYKH